MESLARIYLDNRYWRTAIYDSENSNNVSSWAKIRHGVPQGRVGIYTVFFYI